MDEYKSYKKGPSIDEVRKTDRELDAFLRRIEQRATEPNPCPEDGCPRDGSAHVGCPCSSQYADVETVREDIIKIVREVIIMWDHGGCGPLHPYSIPGQRLRELIYDLDLLAGKEEQ